MTTGNNPLLQAQVKRPRPLYLAILSTLLLLPLLPHLTSCSEAQPEYSDFHPNLTIENDQHLDATLGSAMDPMSTGIWCHISTSFENGARYYVFRNNQGLTSKSIFNALDTRRQSQNHMGMNNGLIVGFNIYGDGFFAYDAQCPYCFDYNALPMRSYPLVIANTGQATCNHCQRTFDLSKWPNGLTRYRATTTGPQGLLRVF